MTSIFNSFCFKRLSMRTGKQYLLTKGDNNEVDDRGLYNPGQMWIMREDILGKVKGFYFSFFHINV